MCSGGEASGAPVSPRNACSLLSPSAPTINTIGSERPSVVVTIGEPLPSTEPHQAVSIAGAGSARTLKRDQSLPRPVRRTVRAVALQRDENAVGGAHTAAERWRYSSPPARPERAADAAEVIAVEKIGVAGFADGEDQLPGPVALATSSGVGAVPPRSRS